MPESKSPSILETAERIAAREAEGATIAVVAEDARIGVEAAAKKRIGKGWSVGAWGQWMRGVGYRAAAVIGWRPAPPSPPPGPVRINNDDEDDGA